MYGTLQSSIFSLNNCSASGGTFNLGSGVPRSISDILNLCGRLTGHSLEVRQKSELVRAAEVQTLCCDTTKFGAFSPDYERIRFSKTIEDMLNH